MGKEEHSSAGVMNKDGHFSCRKRQRDVSAHSILTGPLASLIDTPASLLGSLDDVERLVSAEAKVMRLVCDGRLELTLDNRPPTLETERSQIDDEDESSPTSPSPVLPQPPCFGLGLTRQHAF